MLDAGYIQDHMKYVKNIKSEMGQEIAQLLLDKAIQQLGDKTTESLNIPLVFEITEMKLLGCLELRIEGKRVGHIGV